MPELGDHLVRGRIAYRAKQPWWLTEAEEQRHAALVARYAETDPWEELVLSYAEKQTHVRTHDVLADVLLELAAVADEKRLERVKRGVDAVIAGNFDKPAAVDGLQDPGPTFREFAERWTSGELSRDFPDYIRTKAADDDDIYRLEAHVYDLVVTVPLKEFRAEHAELVMRSLPPTLTPGTRRQVAQLLSRVMRLAVYPARILERSPIPLGFLPKTSTRKAREFLYPNEDRALLGSTDVPVLDRFFYGFLAREGLRSSEASALE